MYDLMKTFFANASIGSIATGEQIDTEGAILVSVMEGGVQKVKLSTGTSKDRVVGWSSSDNQTILTKTDVVPTFVPRAPGPFLIQMHPSIVAGNVRIQDVVAGKDLKEVAAAPAAGEYQVDYTTGAILFNTAEAGHSIVVYYRYNLTVIESRAIYYQRNINNTAGEYFGQVSIGWGYGEIFTDRFDMSKDWTNVAPGEIKTAARGLVTVGGTGVALNASVIAAPSSDVPLLGLRFTTVLS